MDARAPQSDIASRTGLADGQARTGRTAFDFRTAEGRKKLRGPLMIGGVLIVAVAAFLFWLTGGRYESTDDAYVQADKLMVSAEVSGKVLSVDVKEGQQVKKDDVLFRIDPLPFEIALENAKAKLASAMLGIDSQKADYLRTLSSINSQKAQVALVQRNYDRVAQLASTHFESHAALDQARSTLTTAQDTLQSLQHQAQMQLAKLAGDPNIADGDHPDVRQAQAAVDEAQRQLNVTVVRAPFGGIVTQVSQLQPGAYLVSMMAGFVATSAVGLVSSDNLWVEAQMKETQLTHIKPGDPVRVHIDSYPGRDWKGAVDSVSPASGSEFSMLPAVNSSGNWVKVVQRISVRIRLEHEAGDPPLRAGTSARVRIDTGHKRSLGDLF